MQEYLETLVSFHPVSHDQQAVLRLLQYVGGHFEKRGFVSEIFTYNGVHNLYASPTGIKHSKLLLQAHADVVPNGQPFRIENDRAYGRGVYDMLFAIASYMKLADELYEQDINCDIAFMLSGDEEEGGNHGVKALLDNGFTADVCILPDAGDEWGAINVAAKGIYRPTINIEGKSHHGARPWDGDGAAIKLAHFVVDAEKLFDASDQNNSTMTVAMINAGSTSNQGPAEAEVTLDIRYKDQTDFARILAGLEPLLKKYDGKVVAQLDGNDYQLDPDVPLIKTFLDMYEAHVGQPIRMTRSHGSSDARFFAEHNISVILLQPNGGGHHGDTEWLSLPHLQKFYDLLKEYTITTTKA